jgi:HK97 family phage portal protein
MTIQQRFYNWVYGTEAVNHNGVKITVPTIGYNNPQGVAVATTCIKILAETIGKMPLHVWKQERGNRVKDTGFALYDILHAQPNGYTNSNSFFQALEYHRNYTGNSFARIHRNAGSGAANSIELIAPSRVKGYKITDNVLFYELETEGQPDELVNHMNMLHFRMMSPDGVWGINPIKALALNMGIMHKGSTSMDSFFANNAMSPKALKHMVATSNIGRNKEAMAEFTAEYAGSLNAGKWLDLPPNTDVVDLSIDFASAQIIESLQFNGQQISALYGVPVYMATGDFTQSKYNNIEQSQLSFKVNTVSSITKMYEAELEFKLFTDKQRAKKKIRFNINSLVEPDTKTKSEYYRSLANIGAISAKTIAGFENLPISDIQDNLLVMTNLQTFDKAVKMPNPETK